MPFKICTQASWLRCASSCKRMEEIRTHTFVYAFGFFPRLQNDSFGILWNARLCQFAFQEGNSAHNVAAAVAVAAIRLKQRISMFERSEANDKESEKKQQSERKQALYDVTFFGTIKTTYNDERWIDNICVVLEKYYIHERVMMIWRQRHVCHVLLFVWVCVCDTKWNAIWLSSFSLSAVFFVSLLNNHNGKKKKFE